MSDYTTIVTWSRDGAVFTDNRYSRRHRWLFDGGVEVAASSSPEVVPVPMSDAAAVDPEEAFVVSLSSCHMLWFLSIAAKRGFLVDSYRDDAVGVMAKDSSGKPTSKSCTAITSIS
jgi:organic hydroperoxide reductase OsmC/OhrA